MDMCIAGKNAGSFPLLFLVGLLVLLAVPAANVRAKQADNDFFDMEIEELLAVKVTSVSKKEELFMAAPSAVYTITAEDITQLAEELLQSDKVRLSVVGPVKEESKLPDLLKI